jgi:phosphohistidine phosphatase SixA
MASFDVHGRLWPPVSFLLLALLAAPALAMADDALWAKLRGGGFVVMIRHATAPGTGDPPGFKLGDCATQRNLSEEGREEARRIGAAFKRERVPVEEVLSSEWCRCRETAALAFGRYVPWPAINSFFSDRAREAQQSAEVRAAAARVAKSANLVLVTHQVNITAVSGVYPASGELVVLQPAGDRLEVVGRLRVTN